MSIRIHLKIFLFILLFYITKQIEIYGFLMLFAILHELGHLGMGVLLGLKPETINIMPLGVSISFKTSPKDYNEKIKKGTNLALKKMLIAMAGPIMNFVIVLLFIIVPVHIKEITKLNIIYANILIGTFNLLPIYPLDGGRILKNLLHILYGLKNSNELINKISNVSIIILTAVSSITILYFENIAILLIIIYLWGLVIKQNKNYEVKKKVYDLIEKSV